MRFIAKKNRSERFRYLHKGSCKSNVWHKLAGVALCIALFATNMGDPLIFAANKDVSAVTENQGSTREQDESIATSTEDTNALDDTSDGNAEKKQPEKEEKSVYTLHLTHYIRFTVNGEGRSVREVETLTLSEDDFKDGICDLHRFAYDVKQLMVTEANPLSLDNFGKDHEGGARIVYSVNSGWQIVPASTGGYKGAVLRDIFIGQLSDYQFIPANVIRMNVEYKYSNTGGLQGIDAADPEIIEALPVQTANDTYEVTFSLPTVNGFRIVMDPSYLNEYLVNKPKGDETPQQLKEMLENGDFDLDINKHVYYYQEAGEQVNPLYDNMYSTPYNQAWNKSRTRIVTGDEGYTATAVCGEQHTHTDEDHGANALKHPKLKVKLNAAQLQNALKNGLQITVNYRRNATWYTVNHWVPKDLSGLSEDELKSMDTKEVNNITYVLLNREQEQGRVGGLTRARAKTEGTYALLMPLTFSQKLIESTTTSSDHGFATETTVDIYYREADFYRVIFDTDYTYIPRQQRALGECVDFTNMKTPQRKGYTFAGWQYLKKDAELNNNGSYDADAYVPLEKKDDGNYILEINEDLIAKDAKMQDIDGVLALHLYPIWEPAKTQVTVILWTEDLSGVDDVQAVAENGNTAYYDGKYKEYADAPVTHEPSLQSNNTNYSNVKSFTMEVATDSSLVADDDATKLLGDIQTKVTDNFKAFVRDTEADNSQFYTQNSFSILHEANGAMDYSTTSANADGKTMVYVYFTRNIYTLTFHYYGNAVAGGVESAYCVATGTNGFSYAGESEIIKDGELQFYYTKSTQAAPGERGQSNTYVRPNDINSEEAMPVPKTITITAKYGADLRDVWPASRATERLANTSGGSAASVDMISWATTQGRYRDEAMDKNGTHFDEPTIMGLYATMDAQIIADPMKPAVVHHLVAYWSGVKASYYRYNHCYELPGLTIRDKDTSIKTISLFKDSKELKDTMYLVPIDHSDIKKYGFIDLLPVSYDEATKTITYGDKEGTYYAVRGYMVDGDVRYYAVARQLETKSTNIIRMQNPSARAHMSRANSNADHTSKHGDNDGADYIGTKIMCGSENEPYDLYFYYNRERYTIMYMVPNTKADDLDSEVELGRILLPYGAHVTEEEYAFQLDCMDTNQTQKNGKAKYQWLYPMDDNENIKDAVPVCPDRHENSKIEWTFKGWGLGPAGVHMQWQAKQNDSATPQAQTTEDFYIESNMRLYAIWETPMLTVTFHLNGGQVSNRESIEVIVPANTVYTAHGFIPRPIRSGYTLKGWYQADENGTITDEAFNFDDVVISNQHVGAAWTTNSTEKYSYNVYYVTKTLRDEDKDNVFDTVQINERGEIADNGDVYYVLEKMEQKDQIYAPNSMLNLTAKLQPGYVPRETNKTMELKQSGITYDVIFYYDAQTIGSHLVRFVEAGSETLEHPTTVKALQVQADQTVVTPNADIVAELMQKGYQLVNKGGDKTYTEVSAYQDLTWIDAQGNIQDPVTLKGDKLPAMVTYLVQPITYTITYQNADDDLPAADAALSAITAATHTPPHLAKGKNPTQYSLKDSFTLQNPGRVYDNKSGKWYQFSHWSLKDGTTLSTQQDAQKTYTTLRVDAGTVGDLTFIANWKEDKDIGDLTVSNIVLGDQGDREKAFAFTMTLDDKTISGDFGDMHFEKGVATFTLKHGEQKCAKGLPDGMGYEVMEADYTAEGYTTTSHHAKGSIVKDTIAEAAFINTKETVPTPNQKTGNLTVSNTVTGNAGDTEKSFTFTVTLQDATINGSYGDMDFHNGVAVFTLKHGERKAADKLPANTPYTVMERNADGYEVFAAHATGVIEANKTITAAFRNHKDDKAEVPVEPEKPKTPSMPETPTQPKTSHESDVKDPVHTGDSTNMDLYMSLLIVAGACIAVCMFARKKANTQKE